MLELMIENNQQFAKLMMELIYQEFVGFNILEHRVTVNKRLQTKKTQARLNKSKYYFS
jgi:hypothetical protein